VSLRRHPHRAWLFLIDKAYVFIKECSEHIDEGARIALHDVVLCVRHSEELGLSSFEESVRFDDPICAFRAKKVPICVGASNWEALDVEK